VLDECDEDDGRTLHMSFRKPSPAFSLQNLRYALAAADYGSFRRAAEALLLRQSTLSRCVRQLEESIGMAVFERSSGGVRATQAGRQFLRSARLIFEQVEALAARTQSTGRGEAGRLAVGFYTSLAAGNLRATLIDVSQRFPRLELEMFESSRVRLVRRYETEWSTLRLFPGPPRCRNRKQCRCGASAFSSRCLKVTRSPSGNRCIGSICGRRRSFSADGIRVRSCMTS
jgi:hypothetical protein